MDADSMMKFEIGAPVSKAAGRREARDARRLNQHYKMRRTRLIIALKILGLIRDNFSEEFKKIEERNTKTFLPYPENLQKEDEAFFAVDLKRIQETSRIKYWKTGTIILKN